MNSRVLLLLLVTGAARAEDAAFFESKIRPILVEHCYECHSADQKQKGGLLLDTKEGTLKGGDTGPAIVPGDPAKSLLIEAVKGEGDLEMPPKKKLTAAQIADLEAWVKAGAPDPRSGPRMLTKIEQHFEDAKKHWSFQPVVDPKPASLDAIIGLKDTKPADKRTLIRRAYFDLIGVPPTYEEVSDFIADSDPGAFEKLVDRLLADPRYGERWGRHWLDVARYADNMGSIYNGDDSYANAFTYRDYVIDAFNSDKPYDRFLLEQIAADQVDTATDARTLRAMGFLGLGRRKDRRVDDDFYDDTIDVIGRGLQGLTVSCARCHDHKLEPITTKDYYGLYAVLRSSKEPEVQPPLPMPDSPEAREYTEKNRKARGDYAVGSIKAASEASATARSRVGEYLEVAEQSGWKTIYDNKPISDMLNKRKLLSDLHNSTTRSRKAWIEAHPEVFGPFIEFITGKKLEPAPALHPAIARAFATPAKDLAEVAKRYNEVFAPVDAAWRKQIEPELSKSPTLGGDELDLATKVLQPKLIARLDELEANHPLPDAEDEALRQILIAKDSPMKIAPDRYATSRLFSEEGKKFFEPSGKEVDALAKHPGAPARAMAWLDADKMYDGKVFIRGNPQTPGPEAPRRFLTVLGQVSPEPFPQDKSGRLQLAQAIASRDNPLTARVFVNRVWTWHFGEPIVATPSDFGFRGEKPVNQPLLDHLAAWFMDHGWSLKKLHCYLMLTDAYQRADFPMRPLELEPFRDSLLTVTGRLRSDHGGKAEIIAGSTRRTVYGFVDRKTLPSLYRSFDFPDPNFSAPKRSRTALTPRALILMNSPLLTDSAKSLAASLSSGHADDAARIGELYRRVFQRQPTDRETRRLLEYLAAYPEHDLVHPESQDWQYGFGDLDADTKRVKDFTSIANFDGKAFKGSGVMLDAMGGDPGPASHLSTIRRWVAPLDGEVDISAELVHMDEKSDGVVARILSSRDGLLGEWKARNQAVCTDLAKVSVKKGDTLDFIVSSVGGKDAAAYQWSPSIVMPGAELPAMPGMSRRWDARVDFSNPKAPLKPLSAWEGLCQAVLLSPEFAVME
ncbi:MAG: PSD1 domain-containing protein [Verrucomicrobiales bacterium]|nr:PSD1 domain-containing protein [Verrucomicrobiales bacterium]